MHVHEYFPPLSSAVLDTLARKLALLNSGFNILGVFLYAAILQPLIRLLLTMQITASEQVAMVHTVFNLAATVVAILLLPYTWPRFETWLKKTI